MNLQTVFQKGQAGYNVGIKILLPKLNKVMRGIGKKMIYGVAGGPKSGKSKFTNYVFLISVYESMLAINRLDDVEWIYYSFEMDRVTTEFNIACYYFYTEYNVYNIIHNGRPYGMCADYLMTKLIDENDQPIPVQQAHIDMLATIYEQRIVPMFGRYDENGNRVERGKVDFITHKENPTGLRNYIYRYAALHGDFVKETYNVEEEVAGRRQMVTKEKIVGYKEKNPNKTTIIITDHLRKLPIERSYSMKQNVDKYLEYQVEMRDLFLFTFVDIIHTNRSIGAVERLKFAGEFIYPTGDDLKDTGNLSEDCNTLFTIFNAGDEKYSLTRHFGKDLVDYPLYRSIHIVESRETACPFHLQLNMHGGINYFEEI